MEQGWRSGCLFPMRSSGVERLRLGFPFFCLSCRALRRSSYIQILGFFTLVCIVGESATLFWGIFAEPFLPFNFQFGDEMIRCKKSHDLKALREIEERQHEMEDSMWERTEPRRPVNGSKGLVSEVEHGNRAQSKAILGWEAEAEANSSDADSDGAIEGVAVYNALTSYRHDKLLKALSVGPTLPRSEIAGGFIFGCNNEVMQQSFKRQLFGLPERFWDAVRSIEPGLPLFLYNCTTHQLHGVFEADSFGGFNMDPTPWEDKELCRKHWLPAQVKIRVRKPCKPLDEDSFAPVLNRYQGPIFIPMTLKLLKLFDGTVRVRSCLPLHPM